MRIPSTRCRVIAEIDRNKGSSGLHQTSGQQCLLTPQVFAITIPHGIGFARQIERLPNMSTDDRFDRPLLILIHRIHRAGRVEVPTQAIEVFEQALSLSHAFETKIWRETKHRLLS